MSIDRIVLDDFTGGQWPKRHPGAFTERQWSTIKGFVFEDERTLRTQWAWQPIGTELGFDQLGVVGQLLIARKPDGTFWWCEYPRAQWSSATLAALVWTQLPVTADPELHIAGPTVLRQVDTAGHVPGLLLNGRERAGNAYAVWESRADFTAQVHTYTAKWPASGGSQAMPPANRAVMWNDFLVLADIRWFDDDTQALSDTNNKIAENYVWFSTGGTTDTFDPLDVVPVNLTTTVVAGQDSVEGMVPVDAGLLVVTTGGVALLRGTPDNFVNEPLRASIAPNENVDPVFWPHSGAMVLMDMAGQLWTTNSEDFLRIDTGMDVSRSTLANEDGVWGWHENLLWARDDRLLCFHAFDVEGAWCELVTPNDAGVREMLNQGDQLYAIARDTGRVWRMNRLDQADDYVGDPSITERGQIDGTDIQPELATRPLSRLGGHDRTMWHRYGLRAQGPGELLQATWYTSAPRDPDAGTFLYDYAPGTFLLDEREDRMWRCAGPSLEGGAGFTFSGDVIVDAVELWVHRGRGER